MVISATHYLLFDENVSALQSCSCDSCENAVGILFSSLKANICHFYNSCQTTLREIPVLRIEKMYFNFVIEGVFMLWKYISENYDPGEPIVSSDITFSHHLRVVFPSCLWFPCWKS